MFGSAEASICRSNARETFVIMMLFLLILCQQSKKSDDDLAETPHVCFGPPLPPCDTTIGIDGSSMLLIIDEYNDSRVLVQIVRIFTW